jgi:inner membrane protein
MSAIAMLWWQWLVVGLVLIALEMAASGGFYVIFFGIAALAIGGLHLAGLAGPAWFQFLLFSVISVASLALFRSPLMKWLQLDKPGRDVDSLVGEVAMPLEDIVPGAVGRAELRGTVWSARNATPIAIIRGQRCKVVRVDGLMIFLEAEGVRA